MSKRIDEIRERVHALDSQPTGEAAVDELRPLRALDQGRKGSECRDPEECGRGGYHCGCRHAPKETKMSKQIEEIRERWADATPDEVRAWDDLVTCAPGDVAFLLAELARLRETVAAFGDLDPASPVLLAPESLASHHRTRADAAEARADDAERCASSWKQRAEQRATDQAAAEARAAELEARQLPEEESARHCLKWKALAQDMEARAEKAEVERDALAAILACPECGAPRPVHICIDEDCPAAVGEVLSGWNSGRHAADEAHAAEIAVIRAEVDDPPHRG